MLAFLAAGFQQTGILLTVREHYSDYYRHLNEPPVFFPNPMKIGAGLSFIFYIIAGEYKQDEVPEQVRPSFPIVRGLYLSSVGLVVLALLASAA